MLDASLKKAPCEKAKKRLPVYKERIKIKNILPRTGKWPFFPMLETLFSKENLLLLDASLKKALCKNAKKQHNTFTTSYSFKKAKKTFRCNVYDNSELRQLSKILCKKGCVKFGSGEKGATFASALNKQTFIEKQKKRLEIGSKIFLKINLDNRNKESYLCSPLQ
ncbi:hypothetical protein [Myroides odoratus]|uniref:hypothetical protein n=1 Tax=Myroides odoratus TaxID=256 RepID=UPI000E0FF2BE|nr:hypothetical protein [Myroides odoratus]QQU03984.1 hypothetical protein I6I89_01385 [Myroides odoratus]